MRFLVQSFRPSSIRKSKEGCRLYHYTWSNTFSGVKRQMLGRGNYHIIVCFAFFPPFFRSPLSLFVQSSANRCVIRTGTQLDLSLCFLTKGFPKGGRYYKKGWSSIAKGEVGARTHCRRLTTQCLTIFVHESFVLALSGSINVSSSGARPSISLDSIF